jgi:glycosyltransferase involved in cell wall biosynthesis
VDPALPTLSIVTISFQQARYLPECLGSVISQRTQGVQYVVVDPGSTDGSREIIEAHRGGIDMVRLEPDAGPADGLNRGMALCTGEVLGYINADDRLCPGAIDYVRRYFLRHPEVDVLCGSIRIVDAEGRAALRRRTPDRFDLRAYAMGVCTVGQQATFFRRSAFGAAGGFNGDNRISWDGELLVDMALAGARFSAVRRVLGDFRVYATSITGSGKFRAKLESERLRIAAKIAGAGVRVPGDRVQRLIRLAYRANPIRHIGYLTAR